VSEGRRGQEQPDCCRYTDRVPLIDHGVPAVILCSQEFLNFRVRRLFEVGVPQPYG
jgi:hypothetical protein